MAVGLRLHFGFRFRKRLGIRLRLQRFCFRIRIGIRQPVRFRLGQFFRRRFRGSVFLHFGIHRRMALGLRVGFPFSIRADLQVAERIGFRL